MKMNKMVATDPVDYDEAETNTDKPDEDKSVSSSLQSGCYNYVTDTSI